MKSTMRRESSNLSYPYKNESHCGFVNEISQSTKRHLQSPPLAISWQNHHSQATSQKQKKWLVNKNFLLYKVSPSLSLEHLQVISKLVENSNLHTINKKYTLQEQVCERCLIKKELQSINVIMQCNAMQLPLNASTPNMGYSLS